jgi:hypothetical protein
LVVVIVETVMIPLNAFSRLAHPLQGLLLPGLRVAVYTQSPQFALIARSDKCGGRSFR